MKISATKTQSLKVARSLLLLALSVLFDSLFLGVPVYRNCGNNYVIPILNSEAIKK